MSRRRKESIIKCHSSHQYLLHLPEEVFSIIMFYLTPTARASLRLCNSAMCSKVDFSFYWRHQTLLLKNIMKLSSAQWEMLRRRNVMALHLSGSQYYEDQLKTLFKSQPQLKKLGISARSVSTLANLKNDGMLSGLNTLIFTDCHFPSCIGPIVTNVLQGVSELCLQSCQNNASWIVDFLTGKTQLQHIEVVFAMHPFQLHHVKVDNLRQMLLSLPKLKYLRIHNIGFQTTVLEENSGIETFNLETLDLQLVDVGPRYILHSFCGLNLREFPQLRTLRVSYIGYVDDLYLQDTTDSHLPPALQDFEWKIFPLCRRTPAYRVRVLGLLPMTLRTLALRGGVCRQADVVKEVPQPVQAGLEHLRLPHTCRLDANHLLHIATYYSNLRRLTIRLTDNCSLSALLLLTRLARLRHVILQGDESVKAKLVGINGLSCQRQFRVSMEPT